MPAAIIGGQLSLPDGTTLPLSKGVRAGDFVFLSGQLGLDENGRVAEGIEAQTRHCLRNIRDALALAGLDLGAVVKATVWLTEVGDFAAFNKVYAEAFASAPPARSTVVSGLVLPGAKIEIEVVAYAG
ncbi:MAG: RidA family protein [Gammaproteobacteria bacterium]|nr:RidA family protein [Gammaproteobacteria bacterium]MCP5198529.1 RidA family protein [Gammaproteobacteria bacterium]